MGGENGYPRDLLQSFTASNLHQTMKFREENQETEEIELNLGLSLGGRFGVDPKESNKLVKSSSIAAFTTFIREDVGSAASEALAPPHVLFPLIRTSSLPMETGEEWRKRKELQCLRRMEAKRKRSEKQRNTRLGKDRAASLERNIDGFSPAVASPFGMPSWASGGGVRGGSAVLDSASSGKANVLAAAVQGFLQPSSQGSLGSHGSSSSGISETLQGLGNCNEGDRSSNSFQSAPEQKPIIAPTTTDTKTAVCIKVEVESPSKKPRVAENAVRETGMKVMEEMPCVSTKGDGPNGRRIEGFLYRYKQGEEVRIVCVCHGSFFTPAEFVKHAGGGDVAHPLRHIVVSPCPSFL